MDRELDIILFGATGFTGKHAIPLISKFTKIKGRNLSWGIAGRSVEKILELLALCEAKNGIPLGNIPIIIANIDDEDSLKLMARTARIIINCCGPYRFLGEPVVKACVEEGTHHVDVSGEPQYMEEMQLKYHERAKEKGIYIVSACGIDSIPCDLGLSFLAEKFKGTLNSAEMYTEIWNEEGNNDSAMLNFGTFESAVHVLGFKHELRQIRNQLYPKVLPEYKPELRFRFYPHKSDIVKGWVLPNLGPDRSVIKRSQFYFYENDSKRPIQVQTYLVVPKFIDILKFAIFGFFFMILSKFSFGRNLLLKYPEFFTNGMISRNPPDEKKIEKDRFCVTIYGKGWAATNSGEIHNFKTSPNRALTVRIKGSNPCYGATCTFLTLAAITVITETEKMPSTGGVYPPGYAFAKTSLAEQINENGIVMEVLKENFPEI